MNDLKSICTPIFRTLHTLLLLRVCLAAVFFGAFSGIAANAQLPEQSKSAGAATGSLPPMSAKNDYSNGDTWICRPGRQDSCTVDLTTTIVEADGRLSLERYVPNPKAPIDCFYVYPTISAQPTPNSDMTLGPAEKGVVRNQFARFGSRCRMYAPLYRQVTLTALRAALIGIPPAPEVIDRERAVAYNDVVDAWHYYLEHDNHGRGVVLIGHSQGASILMRLIHDEIDGQPVQSRLVSAILLGTNFPVPKGKEVGGVFEHIPLCQSNTQTGCVITYVSFRANAPPPADSRFGRVKEEGVIAGCTNPAALSGGSGELHAYLPAGIGGNIVSAVSADPPSWVTPSQPIDTVFVSVPGMLTAECVSNEHGSYLAITVHSDPAGVRANDIAGDLVFHGMVLQDWGLHLIDVNLAMGNLVDIVRQESKAYLAGIGKK
jgi:pimeloyl-ACP methyl ester carboxylesterase